MPTTGTHNEQNEQSEFVFGVCEVHVAAKRGVCAACKCCRKCRPSRDCTNPGNHITSRMGRRKSNPGNKDTSLILSNSTEKNPEAALHSRLTQDSDEFRHMAYNIDALQCTPLQKIFLVFGLEQSLLDRIPAAGIRDMNASQRELRRAKQIMNMVLLHTAHVLVQGDENRMQLMKHFQPHISMHDRDDSKLKEALSELSFFGDRLTSTISQSILAQAVPRIEAKSILLTSYSTLDQSMKDKVAQNRRTMGKVKFASLRQAYATLAAGNPVPKQDYTYRVDARKIAATMQFLQTSLQVKPGLTRDISVAGSVFRNMPVYERGGKIGEDLFTSFRTSVADHLTVGMPTFRDILKLLTKHGEAKAGLSTYFIRMRSMGKTFILMMHRVKEILATEEDNVKIEYADQLIHDWKDIENFVLWEYSNVHLSLQDSDCVHCCTHALGGRCMHVQSSESLACAKCSNVFQFFSIKVSQYLKNQAVSDIYPTSIQVEVGTMITATSKLSDMMKHYLAHRLRAKVQFSAIRDIKNWLKRESNTKMLLVVDHKQKVLPMKFRGEQVEYYGKTGMSVLGAMQVTWAQRDNLEWGFEYKFYDLVVKGYPAQDHLQVCACIEQLTNIIAETYVDVREVCVQSDNATCFGSQELLLYFYHMNKETTNQLQLIKWIFTEAQTGRGRLDTYFSYVNVILQSYVEDGHDINLEEDIFKGLLHREGIAGTTVILLDATNLSGKALSRPYKARRTGSRETHEVRWYENRVEIVKSSNITEPEVVLYTRLEQHKRNPLDVILVQSLCSSKPPLFVAEEELDYVSQAVSSNTKADAYRTGLHQSGIIDGIARNDALLNQSSTAPTDCTVGWAAYPGNTGGKLNYSVLQKLRQLYLMGKENKKRKVTADRAMQIVMDEIAFDDWHERLNITTPKIKAFFSMPPLKQAKLLESMESDQDRMAVMDDFDVAVAKKEMNELNAIRIDEAATLQTLNDRDMID